MCVEERRREQHAPFSAGFVEILLLYETIREIRLGAALLGRLCLSDNDGPCLSLRRRRSIFFPDWLFAGAVSCAPPLVRGGGCSTQHEELTVTYASYSVGVTLTSRALFCDCGWGSAGTDAHVPECPLLVGEWRLVGRAPLCLANSCSATNELIFEMYTVYRDILCVFFFI